MAAAGTAVVRLRDNELPDGFAAIESSSTKRRT